MEPSWQVSLVPGRSWEGGQGEWCYVGRRAQDDEPAMVWASKYNEEEVLRFREFAARNLSKNPRT